MVTRTIAIIFIVVTLWESSSVLSSESAPLSTLEAFWDSHMLEGRSGIYRDGKLESVPSGSAAEARKGYICDSGHSGAIVTFTERWAIQGGLMYRSQTSSGEIKLYGRCTFRRSAIPPIPLFHYAWGGGSTLEGYSVVLILHPVDQAKVKVLGRWSFSSNEHSNDVTQHRDGVRAVLSVNSKWDEARINVFGLKKPFEVLVTLP